MLWLFEEVLASKKSNGIRKIPNPNPTVRCTNPAPHAHTIKRKYSTVSVCSTVSKKSEKDGEIAVFSKIFSYDY